MAHLDIRANALLRDENERNGLYVADVGAAGGIEDVWNNVVGKLNVTCFGFEPYGPEFQKLKNRPGVTYLQKVIGARRGPVKFFGCTTVGALSPRPDREERFGETYEAMTLEMDTLHNLREEQVIPRLDILKIDVEGHEYEVLEGAGPYLANETNYVKAEFSFLRSGGAAFHIIDKILASYGFVLFAFNLHHSQMGNVDGGDLLYLKSVSVLLESSDDFEEQRSRILRLITIALVCNYVKYAYICVQMASRANVFNQDEADSLRHFISGVAFLPDLVPSSSKGQLLSRLFFLLSQIFAGRVHHKQGIAKENDVHRSSRLWVNTAGLPRSWQDKVRQCFDQADETAHYYFREGTHKRSSDKT